MGRPTRPDPASDSPAPGAGLAASNHRIKRLRKLVSQRKARSEERALVVEGPALVAEAIAAAEANPIEIEGLYVEADQSGVIVEQALTKGVPIHEVAPGVLDATLATVNPQPVAAVVRRPPAVVADLIGSGVVPVLVDPRDPGNVGTLIRSAEAAGAAGLILAGSAVDPTNPKVLRAAAGAGLRLPIVVRPDTLAVLGELRADGRPLYATVIDDAARPYDEVDWERGVMILGNETHGLARDVIELADEAITIPLAGPTESLNLGVAGSLLCFEALRQRREITNGQ